MIGALFCALGFVAVCAVAGWLIVRMYLADRDSASADNITPDEPVWIDITKHIRRVGRQHELDETQPSGVTWQLGNRDGWLHIPTGSEAYFPAPVVQADDRGTPTGIQPYETARLDELPEWMRDRRRTT